MHGLSIGKSTINVHPYIICYLPKIVVYCYLLKIGQKSPYMDSWLVNQLLLFMYYLPSTEDSGEINCYLLKIAQKSPYINSWSVNQLLLYMYYLLSCYLPKIVVYCYVLKIAQKSPYINSWSVNQLLLYMYYLLSTKDSGILLSTEDSTEVSIHKLLIGKSIITVHVLFAIYQR